MKFKYIGPHDAVDLVGVGTVERGEPVEVTGATAESLAKQADWQRVGQSKSPKKQPAAPVAEKKE